MLTHNILADEQGYRNLANVFPFNDSYVKKQDATISFLLDIIEPASIAYKNKKYGEMFVSLGGRSPLLQSNNDKSKWATFMDKIIELRSSGKIGEVLDLLRANPELIALPEN